jgi:hypothetical protein
LDVQTPAPWHPFEEDAVQTENKRRIWRWLPWLIVPTCLVLLTAASLTRPLSGADEDKPKDATSSSYDQIAPALLGKVISPLAG